MRCTPRAGYVTLCFELSDCKGTLFQLDIADSINPSMEICR
jgi:hypothetical protein